MKHTIKKLISLALALAVSLTATVPAFATNESDINLDNLICQQNLIEANNNKFQFSSTKILSSKNRNAIPVINYAYTTLTIIPKNKEIGEAILKKIKLASTNSNYKEAFDGAYLAKVYTTLYYSETNSKGKEYVSVTKVKGGFSSDTGSGSYVGNSTFVTTNELVVGQSGATTNGRYASQTKKYSFSKGERSWSITPPSSWKAVANVDRSDVGCYYSITLKRGSSETWDAEVINNLF